MKNLQPYAFLKNLCRRDLRLTLSLLVLLFSFTTVKAYNDEQSPKLDLKYSQAPLEEVLNDIEKRTDFRFFYESSSIDVTRKIDVSIEGLQIKDALPLILKDTGIMFWINKNQVVLKPIPTQPKPRERDKLQQKKVSGKVTDEKGLPLFGATVSIKGTSSGTTTDFEGDYSIEVPNADPVLVFSYIGYRAQEVEVGERSTIDVVLEVQSDALDEIVVVGYGTSKKEEIIGSVGVVEMENIQSQAPTVNLDQALQGQVPGVYVSGANGQPGAPARIRIRGTTSLMGSNQPLYVIDGIPVVAESNIPIGGTEGNNLGMAIDQQGLNTPIGNINSSDIESITVLKDASAGAIYGSRAANGVIIINTKNGTYGKEPRFNAEISTSIQEPKTLDVLNAQQFQEMTTTAVENGTINNAYTQSVLDGSYFGNADTNWEEELSPGSPVTTNFNLNLQGGSESTRYYSALGANMQDGVFENTGFDRYSFKLNLDTELTKRWDFGIRTNISLSDQQALDGSVTDRMYIFRPDVPVFDEDGNYSVSTAYNLENPLALAQATNNNKTFLTLGSIFTELEILPGLKAKTLLSLNYNNGLQKSYYPLYTARGGWSAYMGSGDGYAQESRSNYQNLMWENTLRYSNRFFDLHSVDGVLGTSFEQTKNSVVKSWGTGFFNDVLTNISSATVSRDGSSLETASGLASYFGRLNYDYSDKYLLSLSARFDGSSKFAKENKYAFFPAMAVGWRISEEGFLSDNESINEIKLRSSWGVTGQQDFGPYQWRTLYETSDYGNAPAIVLSQLGNDRLKWERSKQFDLGLDFALFENRISGGIGYYVKDTEDAIFAAITPGNTGFSSVLANVGNTRNSGLEFQLEGDIFRTTNFDWNVSLNASTNKNELVKISDDFKDEEGYVTGFGGGGRLREGSPIGLIYGYVSDGLFQTQEEIDELNGAAPGGTYQETATSPGDLRFRDISGPEGVPDGEITNHDQKVIGDTQPDFFGGFTNRLRYKGFSVTALFTYSVGNDLHWFNQARSINFASSYMGENKTTEVLNAWTPENPTNQPRLVFGDPNNNDRISSYYVYDASFVRLKTLNLQYSFDQSTLNRFGFMNSASIFVIGQNLLTFTDYPGADPEASNLYNNDISAGRDNNRFPVAKVFTAGVRIGF